MVKLPKPLKHWAESNVEFTARSSESDSASDLTLCFQGSELHRKVCETFSKWLSEWLGDDTILRMGFVVERFAFASVCGFIGHGLSCYCVAVIVLKWQMNGIPRIGNLGQITGTFAPSSLAVVRLKQAVVACSIFQSMNSRKYSLVTA